MGPPVPRTGRVKHRACLPGGLALALLLVGAALPSLSRAQDSEAPAPPASAAPTSTPPRLTAFVESPHPAGHETEEAVVLLAIVVAVDGTVESAEVVESGGAEFDEAALTAARQFVFEPAMRDGTPTRARIRYRYVFEVVTEVVPPEVTDAEPEVAPETEPEAETEAEPEAEPEADLTDEEVATFSAEGVVEPPPRDAGSRVITSEVLRRIPGTRGDALRAVELLPGVGRPAFGGGVLIVRGAAPGDSQVFLDGNPVPLLYHFGGLTSFYNSALLESIRFVPGNFSVRYGRKIGGILEVEPRDPRTDGYHGFIEISVIDASLSLEGPIGNNFAFAVAFRRSLIDLVLAAVAERAPINFLTAPVYYDYQAIATWRPDAENRFRLLVYGASDELRLLFGNAAGNDPSVRGNFGLNTQFHRFQLSWRHLYGADVEQDVSAGFGLNMTQFGIGNVLRIDGQFWPLNLRSEWRIRLSDDVHVIAGLDMQFTPLTLDIRGPRPTQSEGMPMQSLAGAQIGDYNFRTEAYRPAIYVESDVTIAGMLDLALGVRLDYYREIRNSSADPRLSGRLRLSDQWALRAGVGLFSQPPEFQESAPLVGNPGLGVIHAVHTGLGVDFRVPEYHLVFQLDGFYKHIQDRVVSTRDGSAPFFVNEGLGRIYGMEVAARIEPGGPLPLFGFLSYTLMRSERQDHAQDPWRLFDFDQTHIFTVALVWTIGEGFELGATFRVVSGNPYTPVIGSVNDLSSATYRPIYGLTNSARNPLFNRLDVRLSKSFEIGDVRLLLFLDVQNVYNATNREGVSYSYDYSQTADIPGLPIIPSLGLRGEL